MNKKTIFISYGRDEKNPEDVQLVKKIKVSLEEEFNVLMDLDRLKLVDDWENKLSDDLDASDWVVFFITPYSARRPDGYCLNEITYSLWKRKNIAPVMLTQEVPPLSICRIQYLDIQDLKTSDAKYEEKISKLIEVLKEEKKLGFEGEHLKVLNELKPIKFETVISRLSYNFTGREWVYDEVDKWLTNEDNSRVLWIMAEAGFGKSAITAYLARTHPSAMSVYFCQYDYVESKDPREMLKVLIYELSTQIDGYQKILQTLDIKRTLLKSPEHIFTQLLLEPLQQINKPKEKHFFIIDALDEANNNGNNQIVELISNRFLDLPSWFNIVITSRPEPELVRKLKKFNSIELIADDERNKNDLEQFLRDKKNISNGNLIKALISKSEGNILYLKSIFELEMIRSGELTLENIERLPDSMEGFFLKYFERKFGDIELYEEKYLGFVSLLIAYREGMPELLVCDILGLSKREYNKIKDRFGSLFEVDGDNLIFYHKSIYEWLSDYDKSGDYSADLEEGQMLLDEFMDSLASDSYKNEYMEFEYFNRLLIDRIFEKDKNLEKFFGMIEPLDDKKVIDCLNSQGYDYYLHSNLYKAIELQEEAYSIIRPHYQNNPGQWVKDYSLTLNNLASSYKDNNKLSKAIGLEEKNLLVLKDPYKNNPNQWAPDYAILLSNLATSYKNNNRLPDAIALEIKSLEILKELFNDNAELYAKNYTTTLSNLTSSYILSNRISEAIELGEKNLALSGNLYTNNSKKWAVGYTRALNNLASAYKNGNKVSESIKLMEEALGILEVQYKNFPSMWIQNYVISINNLAVSYLKSNRVPEAIKLAKKNLDILERPYKDNPNQWTEEYTRTLSDLATFYLMSGKYNKAIEIGERSILLLEKCYRNNPNQWAKRYATTLDNLGFACLDGNKPLKALSLKEKSLVIMKEYHGDNREQWKTLYQAAFDNLIKLYKDMNLEDKIKKLKKEHLGIYKLDNNFSKIKIQTSKNKTGRNDPCSCNSGKKYKKCCGKTDE